MAKICGKCKSPLIIGENTTKARLKNYDLTCKSCLNKYSAKRNRALWKKRSSESFPGVYMIFEDNILVYIGESSRVYNRIWVHFHTSPNTKNGIGVKSKDKHRYECVQLCVEENLHKRLEIELELVGEYKPKYNSPYKNIYRDNPSVYPLVDDEILLKERVLDFLDFDTFIINGF